ncbi:hypothetical protein IEQ34_007272 [Dendrobium chrysotoxum]|uniref:Uncharacterized protein n=1 Tax=Dendrobium chrysotoxum TaxID=161865 RepID=A0AAV7H6D1_DENCH|nr:hypothetical protein IEQ34_007272 [Dendrobium chrysotoxum]
MGVVQSKVLAMRNNEVDMHLQIFLPPRFKGTVKPRAVKDWLSRLQNAFDGIQCPPERRYNTSGVAIKRLSPSQASKDSPQNLDDDGVEIELRKALSSDIEDVKITLFGITIVTPLKKGDINNSNIVLDDSIIVLDDPVKTETLIRATKLRRTD